VGELHVGQDKVEEGGAGQRRTILSPLECPRRESADIYGEPHLVTGIGGLRPRLRDDLRGAGLQSSGNCTLNPRLTVARVVPELSTVVAAARL
jgi:hypothetical protein